MYRMECVKVDTLMSGEIDCADFGNKLLLNKDKPAIINVNIGEPSFTNLSIYFLCLLHFFVNMRMGYRNDSERCS